MWAVFAFFVVYEAFLAEVTGGITKYFLLAWCFMMLMYNYRKLLQHFTSNQILISVWLIYYLFSLLWTDNFDQASIYVFTISLSVILFLVTTSFLYDRKDLELILSYFKYFSVILATLSLFFYITIAGGSRYVVSLLGISIDPNNQVALVGIGSGLCLLGTFSNKGIHRIIDLIAYAICLISVFRCGSRSGILLILSQIAIIFLLWQPENNTLFKRLLKWFSIAVIGFGCLFILNNFVSSDTIERLFGLGDLSFTDGTEREVIWSHGWSLFLEAPLFGNGWGSMECHNTYLTMLVDIGILGCFPFYVLLLKLSIKAMKKKEWSAFMLMVSGLLPSFFVGAQNKRFFWISIILPAIILYCKEEKKNDKKSIE